MGEFYNEDVDDWPDEDGETERPMFANRGSALRCETPTNPRNLPCPTCGAEDRLTPMDVALGYQCDACADRAERGYD